MTQQQFEAIRGLQKQINVIGEEIYRLVKDWVESPSPTIESVYGKPLDQLKPPAGYRFTGELGFAVGGEPWMGLSGDLHNYEVRRPVLHLRKCKRLVSDIVDENRPAKCGEKFSCLDGTVTHALGDMDYPSPYILSEPRIEE